MVGAAAGRLFALQISGQIPNMHVLLQDPVTNRCNIERQGVRKRQPIAMAVVRLRSKQLTHLIDSVS